MSDFLDFGPGVLEGCCAVENEFVSFAVGVNAEIAEPFKLESVEWFCVCQRRLNETILENLQRIRDLDWILKFCAFRDVIGVFLCEQVVVEPDFGFESVRGRNPVQGCFDFSAVGGVTAACGRVVSAVQFDDFAGGVFDDICAGNKIGISQTNFAPGGKAEEFFRRVFHKIVPLDIQNLREGDFAGAGGGVFGIIDGVSIFDFTFGVVINNDF